MNNIATAVWVLLLSLITRSSVAADVLKWESSEGHRSAQLKVSASGKAGFTLLSNESAGIRWTNTLPPDRYMERQNLMNGAGVALGDFDGDGWCDLYFCNKQGPNVLYRNLGNWKFEDVTERAGVACANQSSNGATFADINGDGRLDLLVTSFQGPNACFLNLGDGRFTNTTAAAGLLSKGGSTTQALADIDGDGDLDLYVCYFGMEAILRDGGAYSHRVVNGKPVVTGRYAKRLTIINGQVVELGEPDILYLNDGSGKFTPVDWKQRFRDENGQPMPSPPDFGLAVQIRDINGDGFPDIYVCNDFQTPDRLWLNDGHGNFRAAQPLGLRTMSFASMGVDFADIDRDGNLDFFAVEMLSRERARRLNQSSAMSPQGRVVGAIDKREEVGRNTLFWNRGDGTYAEIAFHSGLASSGWSWTPIFIDVDLDGFEDVLISNGHLHDVNDRDVGAINRLSDSQPAQARVRLLLKYPRLDTPNAAFRNQGNLSFTDASQTWGFDSRNVSHGMALGDLDNDGDSDVVVNCLNAPPLIYRNDCPASRVAVRLKGHPPNTQGIGGKITLLGGPVPQSQEIICGGRYLSGDDPVRVFAAGSSTNSLRLEVIWRNGKRSSIAGVKPNTLYEVDEAGAQDRIPSKPSPATPMFQDVSGLIAHRHAEEPFDDFSRQPLLPKHLSQLGPGVAWFDLDNDGNDELIVGSGTGGSLAAYHNDGKGGFSRIQLPNFNQSLPDDLTGIVGWRAAGGRPALLVGLANYETNSTNLPSVLRYDLVAGAVTEGPSLPGVSASTGPLAVADIDGDGDLDLFVGGRVLPGRYPEAAASRLIRNKGGKLVPDLENNRILEKVGLVSGAVFSDLDGDGQADLVLACEWGPVRIFRNQRGEFTEWNPPLHWTGQPAPDSQPSTLSQLTGWWNGVTTGDFDGDGKLDIVVGNWGLNSSYNRATNGPLRLYYGDFAGDGQVPLIEAYDDPALQKTVPWRDMQLTGGILPWVIERFPSHKDYARASVAEILGERMARAKEVKASTLTSMIFLNRGDKFEAAPMPIEAQLAPAMGVAVADVDGDGHEDLFLSQNFFAVRPEDNRCDAGRGLWLRGDGRGGLKPMPGQETGVTIYGEQRGCALGDYDNDGRIDLAVAQNGAATKLYRNTRAKAGLRVRLQGPESNPDGVGATVRLVFGQRMGPAREIHGGGGYWSHDSPVPVLGTPEEPTRIWVRWPGGKIVTTEIPKGAKEICINPEGNLKLISRFSQ